MSNKQEELFLKLLQQNQHRIRKLCTVYARSPEDRKDLEQEVTLNIWKSLPSYRGDAKIDTWMYRIILNVCLKHNFAIGRNQTIVPLEKLEFRLSSDTHTQEEKYENLRYCIQKLEFSDKTIIVLYLEELPYKTIGEIVGISENYVAVKIKRIKSKLLTCLSKIELQ